MRRGLVAIVLLLALAPAARADSLVEVQAVPGKAIATCLRATGTPGGLARWRGGGAELLDGTTTVERVRLGQIGDCAEAAAAPGGAAVVAAPGATLGSGVRAVVRDPGGAFGEPVRLRLGSAFSGPLAVAVSPGGHAVVAWVQRLEDDPLGDGRARVVAARRLPGGAFGPVEALTPWRRGAGFAEPAIAAAMDAAGAATVAWQLPVRGEPRTYQRALVEVAGAAPGADWGVQRLAAAEGPSRPALAVAADGWALLAHDGDAGLGVYERPAGATRFTRVLATPPDDAEYPVVAVREGGGGLVAWRSGWDEATAGVRAVAREAAGPFGQQRRVAEAGRSPDGNSVATAFLDTIGGPPVDDGNDRLRAALAPDGRAVLTWARSGPFGSALTARAAVGTLAGGFGTAQAPGGRLLDVNGVAPLFLSDGRAAVAWTDNAAGLLSQFPDGHGSLHLAVEGGAAVARPAPPRIGLRIRRVQRLFRSQVPRGTVTCGRPCELRARIAGDPAAATTVLPEAGSARLALPYPSRPPGRLMRIRVEAAARGGTAITRAGARVRVVRRPPLPVPAPLDVRAHYERGTIVVRWRTAAPARRVYFSVEATRRRGALDPRDIATGRAVSGRGRTRFRVLLHPNGRPRWVTVRPMSADTGRAREPVTVRVR